MSNLMYRASVATKLRRIADVELATLDVASNGGASRMIREAFREGWDTLQVAIELRAQFATEIAGCGYWELLAGS